MKLNGSKIPESFFLSSIIICFNPPSLTIVKSVNNTSFLFIVIITPITKSVLSQRPISHWALVDTLDQIYA